MFRFLFLIFLAGCVTTHSSSIVQSKAHPLEERIALYITIARSALEQKNPVAALQSIALAEKLDPRIAELHYVKALAYLDKKELSLAMLAIQQALKLDPSYSDAKNALGALLIRMGKAEEAIPYLKSVTEDHLFQNRYMAWINLGIIKFKAQEYHQARIYFDHAVLDAPGRACSAYYYLGQMHQLKEEWDQAIQEYRRATQRFCAHFGEAEMALGLMYQQTKQYDRARKVFLDIQDRFPESDLANRAMTLLKVIP